nr:MAG TPA: hypothetical protein [Caudoviricetes sp.]
MASFNGNIDLLSLNGAKVLVGIDEKNAQRVYVCIPVDVNEIKVEASKNDANKTMAKMRVIIDPYNEQYKATVRQRAAERGDKAVVPTHEMKLSYSVDYIKAIAKAYPKLVEQVKEAGKAKDPDIVNQDFNDENTHLFKSIRNRMNKHIASLYQPQYNNQQTAYPQQAYNAAGNATAYVPPADGGTPDYSGMPGDNDPERDLPF